MRSGSDHRPARILLASLLVISAGVPLVAQAEKGDGSIRLEYQFVRTGEFDSSIGDIDIGNTDGHVVLLSMDYAITDRWTVTASLPWIRRRHRGALPHNTVIDITEYAPTDLTTLDDGEYHSKLQDLYVGVGFLAKTGPLSIEPFIGIGIPTNNYQVYAHAAVGRGIWHLPVGADFRYVPYFSDFRFNWDVAYVFTEKTLGVDISHWLVHANVSYFLNPQFAPKLFVTIKHGFSGLNFPDDYDLTALNDEDWYNHDRMIKHNFVNAGFGLDWLINDRYQLSATAFTMVRPDQVNVVEIAWTFGVTRSF